MLKLFEQYNDYSQVKNWLDKMCVRNYTINNDLTVDVDGSVDISCNHLTEIPIQFGTINGNFRCNYNRLTSLKGGPRYVENIYNADYNNITTLKYHPIDVGWSFSVDNNPHLPRQINQFCSHYSISDLFKYQEEYGIWNSDGSFNKARYDIFLNDCNTGILEME